MRSALRSTASVIAWFWVASLVVLVPAAYAGAHLVPKR
jgi:hypothetical protein